MDVKQRTDLKTMQRLFQLMCCKRLVTITVQKEPEQLKFFHNLPSYIPAPFLDILMGAASQTIFTFGKDFSSDM